ncbi:MAG: hypothetical protein JKX69_06765 [Rhodobacteraceae bacterium]|nr:hypothetical protein [Paracoccaceae bacterium]
MAYINASNLATQTGQTGVNALRLIEPDTAGLVAAIDDRAGAYGSAVSRAITENLVVAAVSGHINILIVMCRLWGR